MSWAPNYYAAPPQGWGPGPSYPQPGYPMGMQHPQGYGAPAPPPPPVQQNPFIPWFRGHLVTLTFNSRPIISTLTTIALERRDKGDWANMEVIGAEIDQAIRMAAPTAKLPLFYLVDSISKNIGAPYSTDLFPRFLARAFLDAYRSFDGVTKGKMEELLATWRRGGPGGGELFAHGVREEIEAAIFGRTGKPQEEVSRQSVMASVEKTLAWKRERAAVDPYDERTRIHVAALVHIANHVQSTNIGPAELVQIQQHLDAINAENPAPAPAPIPPPQPIAQPSTSSALEALTRSLAPPSASGTPVPGAAAALPDMGALFRNLAAAGVISGTPTSNGGPGTPDAARLVREGSVLSERSQGGAVDNAANARIEMDDNDMKAYEDMILGFNVQLVLEDLQRERQFDPFQHLPHRCSQCSARFATGKTGKERLQAHLDWHFRRNRKERESEGREGNRRWLPRAEAWVKDVATSNHTPGEAAASATAGGSATASKADRRAALLKKWVPVPADPAKAATPCPICKEHFQSEFAEDEEEWIWRNAVKAEGQIFHATCRADAMSSAVANKLLATDASKPATSARAKSPARTSRAGTPQAAPGSGPAVASPLKNGSSASEAVAVVKEEPSSSAPAEDLVPAPDSQSLKRKAEDSSPSLDADKEVKKERLDTPEAES